MNRGNSGRAVWAGTFTALVLVIAFGNQWLWKELLKKEDVGENSGWHILAWLNTPHWVIDKSDEFENLPGKYVTGYLVGVLALLVAVAVVNGLAARRPDHNAFISGWFSLVVGGAAYGLVSYLISGDLTYVAIRGSEDRSLSVSLAALGHGAGYGFLVGWAVGGVCALAAASRSAGGQFGSQFAYSAPPSPPPPPPVNPPFGGGYR